METDAAHRELRDRGTDTNEHADEKERHEFAVELLHDASACCFAARSRVAVLLVNARRFHLLNVVFLW